MKYANCVSSAEIIVFVKNSLKLYIRISMLYYPYIKLQEQTSAGRGIVAAVKITPCMYLFPIFVPGGVNQWINFMNHSCNPNCEIRGVEIYSIKEIQIDEELSIDYDLWTLPAYSWNFSCYCRQSNCRAQITGPKNNRSSFL